MDIGHKIKLLRLEKKVSTSDFSELLGITRTTLHNWEEGKIELKRRQIEKIADACKVPVNFFYSEPEQLKTESWYQAEISRLHRIIEMMGQTLENLSGSGLGKLVNLEKGFNTENFNFQSFQVKKAA